MLDLAGRIIGESTLGAKSHVFVLSGLFLVSWALDHNLFELILLKHEIFILQEYAALVLAPLSGLTRFGKSIGLPIAFDQLVIAKQLRCLFRVGNVSVLEFGLFRAFGVLQWS